MGLVLDALYRRLMDNDFGLNDSEVDHPNMPVMRWRKGAFSGSDLAHEPGLKSSRTYQQDLV